MLPQELGHLLGRDELNAKGRFRHGVSFATATITSPFTLKAAYASDPYYAPDAKGPSYLTIQPDGFWYFNSRICISADPDLRGRLLYEFHDAPTTGHPGYIKTLNVVATHIWWPRIIRTVRAYVASGATCQRIKALPTSMKLHLVFHVSRLLPWQASDAAEFPDRCTPDQPIRSARDYIHRKSYIVDKLLDVQIDVDPASVARPLATCLFFKVKWARPYHADEHDSWEPLRALTRLDALRDFLSSSAWQRFAASDAFKRWAAKPANKRKLPKLVTFALAV